MQYTNYWYHGQIRRIITHTLRIFANFQVSDGVDDNGNEMLRFVPVSYMTTDKSAASLIAGGSDAIIQSCPRMILTISALDMNQKYARSAAYYPLQSTYVEKHFNEETGNYENKPGDMYNITRLNPVPLKITFKLYILTTMQTQKFQLFEQIRTLFNPDLELQTSENPLDWTRITAITMKSINWSSKSLENVDSKTFDSMDLSFDVNTNLDMPSLVQRQKLIEKIRLDITNEDTNPLYDWQLFDSETKSYYPDGSVKIYKDENNNQYYASLFPTKNYKSWEDLINLFKLDTNKSLKLNLTSSSNTEQIVNLTSDIIISKTNHNLLELSNLNIMLNDSDIIQFNEIINPHEILELNTDYKYLLTEEITNNTILWNKLYDLYGNEVSSISPDCVIESYKDGWKTIIDPHNKPDIYYIQNDETIYTYNNEYDCWVSLICKTYRPSMWNVSEK